MILRGFGSAMGLPDLSPFCAKANAFLRIAALDFQHKPGNPRSTPKQKLPVLEHEGKMIADSSAIIEYLTKTFDLSVDDHLTPTQKALGTAIKSMLEEDLYFVLLYFRWQEPSSWKKHYKAAIGAMLQKGGVPGFLSGVMASVIRRGVLKTLHGQGAGRNSFAENAAKGNALLDALDHLLSQEGPFLFGEKATSYDATVYSFLSGLLLVPIDSPLKEHASQLPHLPAYVEHFKARYYPE